MTAQELGERSADLFLGFSCFLKEQAEARGLQTLFFCTREGHFFKSVFDALFNSEESAGRIDTRILHVSRKSVFPASILGPDGPDFSHLFRLYKSHSPITFLKSLAIEPLEFLKYFENQGLQADRLIENTSQSETFRAVLENPEFVGKVEQALRRQKSSVFAYFNQEFGGIKEIALVDIGWRATGLAALGRLFPDRHFLGLYLGLAPERNQCGENCSKVAYGPDFDKAPEYTRLLHAVDVLEFACLSDSPSTVAYRQTETGNIVPVASGQERDNVPVRDFSIGFQRGVLSVASTTDADQLMKAHVNGELRARAMDKWREFIARPAPALVEAYFSFRSDESFGLAETKDQSATPSAWDFFSATCNRNKRKALKRYLIYNQWAAGMVRRRDLGLVQRGFLYLIMKSAERVKNLQQRYINVETGPE